MAQSTTMTLRLENDLKTRLDKLSIATNRSRSFLAAEAVREFIELNEWQIGEIENAIKEADAGDFATDQEARKVFSRWEINES
ncbi:MAG: ribbon-helix-helix protein, CopG family [Gammaproteobacteria bacterium]|nr:ribbon-helix-helix protein, CopG family [Gammaproteobacteria bacterium]